MLKKAIGLFLVFTLILGAVYAAGTGNDAASENSIDMKAAELVAALGIIDDIQGENAVTTRAAFTETALRMKGYEKDMYGSGGKAYFRDVAADAEYFSTLSFAADAGIIRGDENGFFYPTREITLGEAVTICINMMNIPYDTQKGIYEAVSVAKSRRMLTGIRADANAQLRYADYINLIYNVLLADCPEVSKINVKPDAYVEYDGKNTLLKSVFDIEKVKGVVQANDITGINFITPTSEEYVIVDGKKYGCGYTNVSEMVGYDIEGYVKERENDEDEYDFILVYVSDKNEVVTVEAEDISGLKNQTLEYIESKTDKKKSKSISDAAVIYNGVFRPQYTADDFSFNNGTVTLIDNNADDIIDVVYVEKFEYGVINSINSSYNTVEFKYGTETLDYENIFLEYYNVNGYSESISSLKSGDVVYLYRSKNAVKGYEAYAKIKKADTRTVTGKITALTSENGSKKVKINQDETEYSISDTYENYSKLHASEEVYVDLGVEATFVVDDNNVIISVSDKKDTLEYGILMKLAKKESIEEILQFKIYSLDGKVNIYEQSKNIKFNGKTAKADDVYDYSGFYKTEEGVKNFNPQLIKYELNSKNEIEELYAAELRDATKEQKFTCEYSELMNYIYYKTGFVLTKKGDSSNKYGVNNDITTVIFLPAAKDGVIDEKEISVNTSAEMALKPYGYKTLLCGFYDVSETREPKVLVLQEEATKNWFGNIVYEFVTKVVSKADEDGNTVKALETSSGTLYEEDSDEPMIDKNNISKGDMVGIIPGLGNKIEDIRKVFSYSATREEDKAKGVPNISTIIYNKEYAQISLDEKSFWRDYAEVGVIYGKTAAKYLATKSGRILVETYLKDSEGNINEAPVYFPVRFWHTNTIYAIEYKERGVTVSQIKFDDLKESGDDIIVPISNFEQQAWFILRGNR